MSHLLYDNDDEDDFMSDTAAATQQAHHTSPPSSSKHTAPILATHARRAAAATHLSSSSQPDASHLACLRQNFGHTAFRPTQWDVIRTVLLERRDCCCIMATGYGKSLCYQFPAMYADGGLTLVVSPLISLMQDQVLALQCANIPAALLGSAQTNSVAVLRRADADGDLRLLYVSPEYITSDDGAALLQRCAARLRLIAIDEAHCVSQWGHDFRASYRRLGKLRERLPAGGARVPILAVTATATERVRADICAALRLSVDARQVCTGLDRANLEFVVRERGASVWTDLGALMGEQICTGGSCIVYCLTRRETERVAGELQAHGVQCGAYHAGLPLSKRQSVHEDFVRDRVQVCVATVAFGMGIDKPDIRLVVHWGAAKDLESYYQEVGRAGRDGQPARCVMLYAARDFEMHAVLRELSGKRNGAAERTGEEQTAMMKRFVMGNECRRLQILRYFGGASATCAPRPRCCDHCNRPAIHDTYADLNAAGEHNYAAEAALLIDACHLFGGYFGIGRPIALLRGSTASAVRQHSSNPLHGRGKFRSEDYWRQLGELLETEQLLSSHRMQPQGCRTYTAVRVTVAGRRWRDRPNGDELWLRPPVGMLKYMRRKPQQQQQPQGPKLLETGMVGAAPATGVATRLATRLLLCRSALATRCDVMPYMVASNRALEQLTRLQPTDVEALRAAQIDGFSEAKVTQFGEAFAECVRTFLSNPSSVSTSSAPTVLHDLLLDHPLPGDHRSCNDSALRLLALLHAQPPPDSLAALATVAGLAESTVCTYLEALLRAGHPIWRRDLERLCGITERMYERIAQALPTDEQILHCTLRSIKQQLPDAIGWTQLKLVLSHRMVREHLRLVGVVFVDPDPFGRVEVKKEGAEENNKVKTDVVDGQPDASSEEADDDPSGLADEDLDALMEDMYVPEDVLQVKLEVKGEKDNDDAILAGVDPEAEVLVKQEIKFEDDDNDDAMLAGVDLNGKVLVKQEVKGDYDTDDDDDSMLAGVDIEAEVAHAEAGAVIIPSKRVRYESASDEEDAPKAVEKENVPAPSSGKRVLPAWMTQGGGVKPQAKKEPKRRAMF